MLDDFQDDTDSAAFLDELESDFEEEFYEAAPRRTSRLLGMTPLQRFIIAIMFLFMVCLIGTVCLVVTGRMVPPFL